MNRLQSQVLPLQVHPVHPALVVQLHDGRAMDDGLVRLASHFDLRRQATHTRHLLLAHMHFVQIVAHRNRAGTLVSADVGARREKTVFDGFHAVAADDHTIVTDDAHHVGVSIDTLGEVLMYKLTADDRLGHFHGLKSALFVEVFMHQSPQPLHVQSPQRFIDHHRQLRHQYVCRRTRDRFSQIGSDEQTLGDNAGRKLQSH